MKNRSKIIIICLIFLMVISIGYALFSGNVNVSGTAHATGRYDLHFESCTRGYPDIIQPNESMLNNGKIDSSCTINGPTDLKLTAKFDRSLIGYTYTAKLINKGTMDVYLEDTEIDAKICADGYTWDSSNGLTMNYNQSLEDDKIEPIECFSKSQLGSGFWEGLAFAFAYMGYGGVSPMFFKSDGTQLDNIAGVILKPNEYIYIVIEQLFGETELNENGKFFITTDGKVNIISHQITN